jgi:hypothetical protein
VHPTLTEAYLALTGTPRPDARLRFTFLHVLAPVASPYCLALTTPAFIRPNALVLTCFLLSRSPPLDGFTTASAFLHTPWVRRHPRANIFGTTIGQRCEVTEPMQTLHCVWANTPSLPRRAANVDVVPKANSLVLIGADIIDSFQRRIPHCSYACVSTAPRDPKRVIIRRKKLWRG